MVSSKPFGIENAMAFRAFDGGYLWTNSPGDDSECGGEVHAHQPYYPESRSDWGGWWVLQHV